VVDVSDDGDVAHIVASHLAVTTSRGGGGCATEGRCRRRRRQRGDVVCEWEGETGGV
jgi:hypothetical protein